MMTFSVSFLAATLLVAPQPSDCASAVGRPTPQRVFTNADLDRMAACRATQSGAPDPALSDAAAEPPRDARPKPPRTPRVPRSAPLTASDFERRDALEADWRARWRSVDQKAKRLRREAYELRAEAAESPRDPKKRVVGRRSPSILISRAERLEAEARDLISEFEELARRQGALPGWLRPKSR